MEDSNLERKGKRRGSRGEWEGGGLASEGEEDPYDERGKGRFSLGPGRGQRGSLGLISSRMSFANSSHLPPTGVIWRGRASGLTSEQLVMFHNAAKRENREFFDRMVEQFEEFLEDVETSPVSVDTVGFIEEYRALEQLGFEAYFEGLSDIEDDPAEGIITPERAFNRGLSFSDSSLRDSLFLAERQRWTNAIDVPPCFAKRNSLADSVDRRGMFGATEEIGGQFCYRDNHFGNFGSRVEDSCPREIVPPPSKVFSTDFNSFKLPDSQDLGALGSIVDLAKKNLFEKKIENKSSAHKKPVNQDFLVEQNQISSIDFIASQDFKNKEIKTSRFEDDDYENRNRDLVCLKRIDIDKDIYREPIQELNRDSEEIADNEEKEEVLSTREEPSLRAKEEISTKKDAFEEKMANFSGKNERVEELKRHLSFNKLLLTKLSAENFSKIAKRMHHYVELALPTNLNVHMQNPFEIGNEAPENLLPPPPIVYDFKPLQKLKTQPETSHPLDKVRLEAPVIDYSNVNLKEKWIPQSSLKTNTESPSQASELKESEGNFDPLDPPPIRYIEGVAFFEPEKIETDPKTLDQQAKDLPPIENEISVSTKVNLNSSQNGEAQTFVPKDTVKKDEPIRYSMLAEQNLVNLVTSSTFSMLSSNLDQSLQENEADVKLRKLSKFVTPDKMRLSRIAFLNYEDEYKIKTMKKMNEILAKTGTRKSDCAALLRREMSMMVSQDFLSRVMKFGDRELNLVLFLQGLIRQKNQSFAKEKLSKPLSGS